MTSLILTVLGPDINESREHFTPVVPTSTPTMAASGCKGPFT